MTKLLTIINVHRHGFWRIGLIILLIALVSCSTATITVIEETRTANTSTSSPTATVTQHPEISPTSTEVPEVIDVEDLKDVAIRFVHPWAGEGAGVFEEIAFEFSMSNPWDIWVDVEAFGSESVMLDALRADLDRGDPPALIAVHPYYLAVLEGEYVSANLNKYFNDPQWGFDPEAQADIPAVFLDPFSVDDNLLALPVAPQGTLIFYNQTWAKELGHSSPPGDEQDFRNQSCDATFANYNDLNVDNDGTGGWLINHHPNVLASWYLGFGGELPEGGLPEFNTDPGLDAFGYLKSVYDQGCFWVGRQSEPYYYFANRYALMYAGTLDQIPAQKGWMAQAENEDEWRAIGFQGGNRPVMLVDGPGLMVTVDRPENQLAAWLFARYLLEPEVQAKIVRRLYTLPVRTSARESLGEFEAETPQWADAVAMIDFAEALPVSEEWGFARWVLQDAIILLLQSEEGETGAILEELDATVL